MKGGGSGPGPQILSLLIIPDPREIKKLGFSTRWGSGRQPEMPHIRGGRFPKPQRKRDAGKENSLAAFQTLPSSRRKAGIFVGFLPSTTSIPMECLVSIVLLMPPKGFIWSCIFLQEGSEHRDPPQHFPDGCSRFNTVRRNSLQTHFSSSFPKEKYPLTLSRTP